MKKYLILGGNGFIGRYLTNNLSKENEVIVADYHINNDAYIPNVCYQQFDFVNCKDFSSLLDGVDTVIHLISTIVPNENTSYIQREIADNVFPTIQLLDDMVKCGTKKIVFLSSGGTVYGEHSKDKISEDEKKEPICNYGIIKDLIEKYLKFYSLYYQLDYRIICLANPYSDVTKNGKSQGIIPIIADQMLAGEMITVWGDGEDVRDYIYIDDAIDAILKIMEYNGEEKVFNVGTGNGYTVNQVLSLVSEQLKVKNVKVCYQDGRKCDVKNNILDIHRIVSLVGWEPKIGLKDGIKEIVKRKVKGVHNYEDEK